MSPSEVLSHLSPQERDAALKTFLAAHQMPREDMTREDWDCLRLAHYDELADEITAGAIESADKDAEAAGLKRLRREATPNHLAFTNAARAA